jgi:putative transposase
MKKSKFTESQIVGILGEGEAGLPVAKVCRKHVISLPTYYRWNSNYSGVSVSELKRITDLEAENALLKKIYSEERPKAEILNEAITKKWCGHQRVVAERGISIRLACVIFSVSQTCYRYEAKIDTENEQIVNWPPRNPGRFTSATGALVIVTSTCVT